MTQTITTQQKTTRWRNMKLLGLIWVFLLFIHAGVQAQNYSLTPDSNPSEIVKQGNPVDFSVIVFSDVALSGAELDITVPTGFEIVSATPALKSGSLSGNKRNARVVLNLTANVSQTVTVKVLPLCDAVILQTISYTLYNSTGTSLKTEVTGPIGNFYTPILNVTYPTSVTTNLNATNQRTISVTQTADKSYANNLQLTADCNKTDLEINKIEVSINNSTWVDVTSNVLATSSSGYVYTFTQANTFTVLGYANNRLNTGDILYIRETFVLKDCNAGNVVYNFAYGDGTTFCSPVSTQSVSLTVAQPGYQPDIRLNAITQPTSILGTSPATGRGTMTITVTNNSTDAAAVLKDILVRLYGSDYNSSLAQAKSLYFYNAHFSNATGVIVASAPPIPLKNDRGIPSLSGDDGTADAMRWIASFDQLPAGDLSALGLSDVDGDGIYSDLLPGASVTFTVEYDLQVHSDCANRSLSFVTRRADLFYTNACGSYNTTPVSRPNDSSGSTDAPLSMLSRVSPNITLSLLNVANGDEVEMLLQETSSAVSNHVGTLVTDIANTRVHKVFITLPEGFEYDPLKPIKTGSTATALSHTLVNPGSEINYDPMTRILSFRNDKAMSYSTFYSIGLKATSQVATVKELSIKHTFNFIGETPIEYACYTVPVNYEQMLPCSGIELTDFKVERTTYGYRSESDLTLITDADPAVNNINKQAAGPYDNVSITADISINNNITLATGEKFIIETTYEAAQVAGYFGFVDAVNAVEIYRQANGAPGFTKVATLPATSVNLTNTNPLHKIAVDISSQVGSGKPIPVLNKDDKLKVVLLTQTTANLPRIPADISEFKMKVYTELVGVEDFCYIRSASFKVFDYRLGTPGGSNTSLNHYANVETKNAYLLRWDLGTNTSYTGFPEVFTNEFRPNVNFSNVIVTMPGLFQITNLYRNGNVQDQSTEPLLIQVLTLGSDYTVTYLNGQTIVSVPNTTSPWMSENYSAYSRGYRYGLNWNTICWGNNTTPATVDAVDYPTSESPKSKTASGAGNIVSSFVDYSFKIVSTGPSQSPKSSIVEWPFTVTNTSSWANTDPVLPNSWVAFECDPGVTPYALLANDGTVLANKATLMAAAVSPGDDGMYDSNKYWFKLGDLNMPTNMIFRLQCEYTACSGTPEVYITYGMNKVAYIDNPKDGFKTVYNSPGYFCNSVTSDKLTFTPPVVDFTGTLSHVSDSSGENVFCDPIDFSAIFKNGLDANVSNMKLQVTLPTGLLLHGTTASVKLGSGAPATVPASVSGTILEIELGSIELSAYGTADDNATVNFQLETTCGFNNKIQVYADFIGESGCHAEITKPYNSQQIKIQGVSTTFPDYAVVINPATGLTVSDFQSGAAGSGQVVLTGLYRLLGVATANNMAFIDIPANMTLASSTGDITFTQTGTRLIALFNNNGTLPGAEYDFTITLTPTNPGSWDCSTSHDILLQSGIQQDLACATAPGGSCIVNALSSISETVNFSMTKLEVSFTGTTTIEGEYGGAANKEKVTVSGTLSNALSVAATNMVVELMVSHDGGTTYVPLATPVKHTVATVAAGGTAPFTFNGTLDVSVDSPCDLRLAVLRSDATAGSNNKYLCSDITENLPVPSYKLQTLPSNEMCQDGSLTVGDPAITGYSYQWTSSDVNGIFDNSSIAQPVFSYGTTVSAPTNVTLTLEVTREVGCTATTTQVITVKLTSTSIDVQPAPTVSTCTSSPVTLSVTATGESTLTYQWYNSGGAIASATNSTYIPTASDTYYVIVSGGCGDVTSDNSVVTINPVPTPTIIGTSTAVNGQSGVVYSTETGAGITGYDWEITGGAITSGGDGYSTATVTWGSGATGTITVTYTSNGCSPTAPASKTVTLSTQTGAGINGTSSVCPDDIVTYTTEDSKFDYDWTVVGGTIQSGGDGNDFVTVKWDGTGTSSVAVSYRHDSDPGLPLVDATESITRKVATIITDPTGGTVCFGETHAMSITVTSCEGTPSFVWKKDGTTTVGTNSASYTADASGSYTVEVTGGCGAPAVSTPVTVTVKTKPTATLAGSTTAVTTEQVTYTAGTGINYNWHTPVGGTITAGGTATDATATVTWGAAGAGSISVDYEVDGCPTTTATVDVTITAQGTPAIDTPATSICFDVPQTKRWSDVLTCSRSCHRKRNLGNIRYRIIRYGHVESRSGTPMWTKIRNSGNRSEISYRP